jgi:hypothetical protein
MLESESIGQTCWSSSLTQDTHSNHTSCSSSYSSYPPYSSYSSYPPYSSYSSYPPSYSSSSTYPFTSTSWLIGCRITCSHIVHCFGLTDVQHWRSTIAWNTPGLIAPDSTSRNLTAKTIAYAAICSSIPHDMYQHTIIEQSGPSVSQVMHRKQQWSQ